MKKTQAWVLLYALVLLADVLGIAIGAANLHLVCKPLLMPMLMALLLKHRPAIRQTPWLFILAGLFLSWAGDLFLLFENRHPNFFIGGLASFLLAHVCYIIYYFKSGASVLLAVKKHPWWMLMATIYSIALVVLLYPKLGSLLIPIIAYAAVLTAMLTASIATQPAMARAPAQRFVAGAVAFVLSDSILAINKFYQPFPMAGVLIMLTYGLAQWLISSGALKNNKEALGT